MNKYKHTLENSNSEKFSKKNRLKSTVISKRRTRTTRKNLNEFTKMQHTLENKEKKFILEEEIEIKNYGAIYISKDGKSFHLTNERNYNDGHKVAEITFNKVLFQKGWDKVSVSTQKTANSYLQSYFAGYLEARATALDIFNFYNNLRSNTRQKHQWNQMKNFFTEVVQNVQQKFKNIENVKAEEIQMWSRLLLGYAQLEGLINGYTYEIKRLKKYNDEYKLDLADFLILQADGEVPELLRYFRSFNVKTKIGEKNYFKDAFGIDTEDPKEFWSKLMWTSKCSALIKLTKDNKGMWKDLLVGHTTWTEYYEMLRSYKHYKFEFDNNDELPFSEMTFSSYPGIISSTDDFYITNNNIVVTETTLEVIDIVHYHNVKSTTEYIPNFMRVLSATRFAKTAQQWCKIFAEYNSGTYSSQWMILDYNVFKKIKGTNKSVKGLVYMLEQAPHKLVYHDITNYILSHSYFGSFNRAFLKKTQQNLDDALIENLYGKTFTYRGAKRRKIVNHLATKVNDLKTLKDVLRYNGYNKDDGWDDPSKTDPSKGYSARSDLSFFRHLSGGVDTKLTDMDMVSRLEAVAISGPTTENNPNLSIFDFKNADPYSFIKRDGVPERFDFPYVLMNPKTISCENKNDIYNFNSKSK